MYEEVFRNEVHCCWQLIFWGKKKDEPMDG